MATLAVFNGKGGVGKTTVALNLAAQAASEGYRVLLWEIDGQRDCYWLLQPDQPESDAEVGRIVSDISQIDRFLLPTRVDRLSLLPAHENARTMDALLVGLARHQRLLPLFSALERQFDLIVFDCPPGFCDANLKILQAVNLVVVPSLASPLAMRSLMRVRDFVVRTRGTHAPLLPVFNMVDRRRRLHKAALAQHPDWPVIPYLSEIERMLTEMAPLASFAPDAEATAIFRQLWRGIESKLLKSHLIRVPGTPIPNPVPPSLTTPRPRALRRGSLGTVRRIFARETSRPVHI